MSKTKKEYKFRSGSGFNGDAKQTNDELVRIRKTNNGKLLPDDVVINAADPNNPLHEHFNWDDSEAAMQWRIHTARNLINSIQIIEVKVETKKREHKTVKPAFVNVSVERKDDPNKKERYYTEVEKMTVKEFDSAVRSFKSKIVGLHTTLERIISAANTNEQRIKANRIKERTDTFKDDMNDIFDDNQPEA